MTKAEDGAFPTQGIETDRSSDEHGNAYDRTYSYDEHEGLTKLEYAAIHIMQGLAASDRISGMSVDECADLAYDGAIALIKRLSK